MSNLALETSSRSGLDPERSTGVATAERRASKMESAASTPFDLELELKQRALDGDVDALLLWRAMLDPIDESELGYGG